MTFPTSDQIASAIVTACLIMKEDPLVVISERPQKSRARQYAFQALKAVFPDASKEAIAFRVGCAGNPKYYAVNSTNGMARFVGGPHKGERMHRFWDEGIFEKVIAAVRAVPSELSMEEPEPTAAEIPRAPVKLSATVGSIVERTRPAATPGKRKLEDMLREAVANTQRMTPPPEEQ